MLTLADVPALCPTRPVLDALAARLALSGMAAWLDPGPTVDLLGTPAPGPRPASPVEANFLSWPTGASRCAVGYFLFASGAAAKVRTASASGATAVALKMSTSAEDDPDGEPLEADVTVLRWLPLALLDRSGPSNPQLDRLEDSYLAMVVDDRFRWNQIACPDFGIEAGAETPVTWEDCFAAVEGALGVDLGRDEVDPAYLVPDASLNLAGAPAGRVLDALCRNVGWDCVRKYDGTVELMAVADSIAARRADFADKAKRKVKGGGSGFVPPQAAPAP